MGDSSNRVATSCGFTTLTRRRQVDSANANSSHGLPQLARKLSIHHLIAIGVGSTIGAGVYILVGTVAREHSGPALFLSFLIAGLAAGLSAFCYAELSGRCPSAGSAYHYSYVFVGEGVAWLVGWALILEYTLGGSAVARGISPNLALFFGGEDSLPFFISRQHIPFLDVTVDPCAAILVAVVTCLLCFGIQSSTQIQAIITSLNVCVMLFVVIAGGYLGFKTGWVGYKLPTGLFPFGVDGLLAGSATVFFAYIGFDSVVSTAEEVRNPQIDLPRGITAALFICGGLYMLVSAVIVGIVPYYAMDPDTPISSAFASHDMKWAVYIITFGALTALCSTLLGSLLPQPRILMAMARDGLLPPFFSEVHSTSHVPVKSTITTGIFSAVLAFFMDVTQLAGMVSVGTLLAFTMVAISVLIVRYVPPEPLPPAYHMSIDSASDQISNNNLGESSSANAPISLDAVPTNGFPLFRKAFTQVISTNEGRRKLSGWIIMLTCVGALILTSSVSAAWLPSILRYLLCGVGAILVMLGLFVLPHIDQDHARDTFGHTEGYMCPLVPYLPIFCILINVYLLVNLGGGTWFRVSLWLVIGAVIYAIYGRKHSLLNNAYVPVGEAEENYSNSRNNEASFAHYAC